MAAIPTSHRRAVLARRQTMGAVLGLGAFALMALAMGAAGVSLTLYVFAQWGVGRHGVGLVLFVVAVALWWFAWRAGGCLMAPLPRPDGECLDRARAPTLYTLVDRMGERFGGMTIDALYITGEMNVALFQRPSRGLWGRMETYLLIGLPLAHSVSTRQLEAIIAHEFGHLYCQRRGRAAWGGHVRAWWLRTVDRSLDALPGVGMLLDRLTLGQLLRAQQLCRKEEFEADQAAAKVVGALGVAGALVEVVVKERFLHGDYWAKVMAQSHFSPRPLIRPYREMGCGMLAGFPKWRGRGDFLRSMFAEEEGGELHPTLYERLGALGEKLEAVLAQVPDVSAAQSCLAAELDELAWALDRDWWWRIRDDWRAAYRDASRRPGSQLA